MLALLGIVANAKAKERPKPESQEVESSSSERKFFQLTEFTGCVFFLSIRLLRLFLSILSRFFRMFSLAIVKQLLSHLSYEASFYFAFVPSFSHGVFLQDEGSTKSSSDEESFVKEVSDEGDAQLGEKNGGAAKTGKNKRQRVSTTDKDILEGVAARFRHNHHGEMPFKNRHYRQFHDDFLAQGPDENRSFMLIKKWMQDQKRKMKADQHKQVR